jgi:hypothetical protein
VPATIIGLALVAFVALPGIVYYTTRGRRRPGETFATYSPRVVAAGVLSFLAALCVVVLVADYWKDSPFTSADDLTGDVSGYLATHARRLVWTGLLLLLLGLIFAWIAAQVVDRRTFLRSDKPHYSDTDPWWIVLREESQNEGEAYAYVDLRNGKSVGGLVVWFSSDGGNYANRDLVLMPWKQSVVEFRHYGHNWTNTLQDALYGEHVRSCEVAVRTIIPGDQIARVDIRFVPESSVVSLRAALGRWETELPKGTVSCRETMGRTVVAFGAEVRMTLCRSPGRLIFKLDQLKASNAQQYQRAKDTIKQHGGKRVSRRLHTFEIEPAQVLDGTEIKPAVMTDVLAPLAGL